VGTWYDPELGRPIAAPLERCAELLGVDLATIRTLAAHVEPYLRVDATKIWSLMQLQRRMRPQVYRRRRGGYLDRRRTRTRNTEQLDDADGNKDAVP
jgi:methionyl-tRNA synthetase